MPLPEHAFRLSVLQKSRQGCIPPGALRAGTAVSLQTEGVFREAGR
jgi:hypothetical protein